MRFRLRARLRCFLPLFATILVVIAVSTVFSQSSRSDIPEIQAYELMMRTLIASKSVSFLAPAGFTGAEQETIMNNASDLFWTSYEKVAHEAQSKMSGPELTQELDRLQDLKLKYFTQDFDRLRGYLKPEGEAKLKRFLENEVKKNTHWLPIVDSIGGAYFYTTSWIHNGQLLASATVVSLGRSTVTFRLALNITPPGSSEVAKRAEDPISSGTLIFNYRIRHIDGVFSVGSSLEQSGSGRTQHLASHERKVNVLPHVSLGPIVPKERTVAPGDVIRIDVPVHSTTNVPVGTVVSIELIEVMAIEPRPLYQVAGGRGRVVTIDSPGTAKNVIFELPITGLPPDARSAEIGSIVRIYKVASDSVSGVMPFDPSRYDFKFTVRRPSTEVVSHLARDLTLQEAATELNPQNPRSTAALRDP